MNTMQETVTSNMSQVAAILSQVFPDLLTKNGDAESQMVAEPRLIDPDKQIEIVDGKVEIKNVAGLRASGIAARLNAEIWMFVKTRKLGRTYGADASFAIGENERMPDVSFVANEKLRDGEPITPAKFAPDLAIEVISPSDVYAKVIAKIRQFFEAGVRQAWLVEPESQTVTIYFSPTETKTLTKADTIGCEELLPGFQLPLSEIFLD